MADSKPIAAEASDQTDNATSAQVSNEACTFDRCMFCEVSEKEGSITGRRRFKAVLHVVHHSDSEYQGNGISWLSPYVEANMQSVKGMSIVAEFLTDDRTVPYGHGRTGVKGTVPLFEDSTVVGHFDNAYLTEANVNGEPRQVLMGEGTLDEMRYPKFVDWLKDNMVNGEIKGSVEIVGKKENDGYIVYEGGWKETGRVPQKYDYCGYAILGAKPPADDAAVMMELNQKLDAKEDVCMDEKTIKAAIEGAMAESNSKWEKLFSDSEQCRTEINQLKALIAEKEAAVAKLTADLEEARNAAKTAETNSAEAAAKAESAEKALAEANEKIASIEKEHAKSELASALASYTDAQKAVAQAEINAFNEDPSSTSVDAIVGKICTAMVQASRNAAASTSETNSLDIFSVSAAESGSAEEEVSIF